MHVRAGGIPSNLSGEPWLESLETKAVLGALTRRGHGARVVGGAVRNALLGARVKDIDIATTALPDEVVRATEAAGLKAVPTGQEHGTITVIANHVPYEVTTLRRDVETFGRHARVTFTTDWTEDARRRDFTINALYCAADGTLHDPVGGLADLSARRVRFIGEARERIREDFLRILRFFRFTAEYAKGVPDPEGLAASAELKDGLDRLSGERLRGEILRLLAAPDAGPTLVAMQDKGILEHVLAQPCDVNRSLRLAGIEAALGLSRDPVRHLGVLTGLGPGGALALRERLRLSNAEFDRLSRMGPRDPAFIPASDEAVAKSYLYRHGAQALLDGVLMAWATSAAEAAEPLWRERAKLAFRWQAPELPVRGADVLALGVPAGPEVGRIMSDFEEWWIGAGFPADPALIARELQRLAAVTKP